MAQDIGGESEPRAGRGIPRRDLAKIAGFVLFAGGYYYVTGHGPRQNNASNPSVPDPNRELAALAAANQDKPIVGNAPGHYPKRAIDLVSGATNLIVITYKRTDVASIGTAWKAQLGERVDSDEITLATAGHVLTEHGQHSLADIDAIWVGHPFTSDSFTSLDPRLVRTELASDGTRPDAAHDSGVIRMPLHIAPHQLAKASALRLASPSEIQPGTPLLVAGVPTVFVSQFDAAGLETTPLYAQVMPPKQSAVVPSGCFGLHGLSGAGVSGASVVGPEGQVVGLVVDYVIADPYTTVAATTDTLRQFA